MAVVAKDIRTRWPGGCVPFHIDEVLEKDPDMNRAILAGINSWETRADVRFIKRTTQSRFVHFKPDPGPLDDNCTTSSIGQSGGEVSILIEPAKGAGTVRHEIGHALGFHHEQKRPDRDNFIDVNEDQIQWWQKHNFEKLDPNSVIMPTDYDLDSVMHYGCVEKMSVNGDTCLITTEDRADQDRIGHLRISPGDIRTAALLNKGDFHIYQLSNDGQLETVAQQSNVTAGWTHLSTFSLDLRTFLFRYKRGNGAARISQIESDGSVRLDPADQVGRPDIGSGWTTAYVYGVGLKKYLFLYKAGSRRDRGAYQIHDIDMFSAKVSAEPIQSDKRWSAFFTSILPYYAGGDRFVAYRQATGECVVHEIEWDGKIGERLQFDNLKPDFNLAAVYSVDGKSYYLRMKTSNGRYSIRRIRPDGTIGTLVKAANLAAGWTTVLPILVGSNTYLLLLNSSSGDMEIRRMRADGKFGTVTDQRRFNSGWTQGTVYGVGTGTYLCILKTG